MRAANDTPVTFDGFVELTFDLAKASGGDILTVPFLVSKTSMANSISGYNVIEQSVKSCFPSTVDNDIRNTVLVNAIRELFEKPTNGAAQDIIDIIHEEQHNELTSIKSPTWPVVLPPKRYSRISCRAHAQTFDTKTKVLFVLEENNTLPACLQFSKALFSIPKGTSFRMNIEVYNPSEHAITLNSRSVLGHVELVKSVTPVAVRLKNEPRFDEKENPPLNTTVKQNEQSEVKMASVNIDPTSKGFLNQFELTSLSVEQKHHVHRVLLEESDSFAQGDGDIGCATGLQLPINLSDSCPVQKTYNAILKPLYPKVNSIYKIY